MDRSRDSVRTDRELGALKWINLHLGDAYNSGAMECDITTPQGIQSFCEAAEVSVETLDILGKACRIFGVSTYYSERQKELTAANTLFWQYRSLRKSWREIEGTVGFGGEDDKRRYTVVTSNGGNTCAIDVVIAVALYLDAWRTRADVLEPRRITQLELSTSILRQLVTMPWGVLTQEQRQTMRDIFAQALEKEAPERLQRGTMVAAGDIIDLCFQGLPQVSWGEARITVCCDGVERIVKSKPTRKHNLTTCLTGDPTNNVSIGDQLSDRMLQVSSERNETNHCTRREDCEKQFEVRINVVTDRMPAMLMVHMGHAKYKITQQRADAWGVCKDITVVYFKRGKNRQTARYRPMCGIFFVDNNHFVTQVMLPQPDDDNNEVRQFDGLQSSSCTNVQTWWSSLEKRKPSVVIMFYQILLD